MEQGLGLSHPHNLTLRSGVKRRVSKGGHAHFVCCPSFETALRASSG